MNGSGSVCVFVVFGCRTGRNESKDAVEPGCTTQASLCNFSTCISCGDKRLDVGTSKTGRVVCIADVLYITKYSQVCMLCTIPCRACSC